MAKVSLNKIAEKKTAASIEIMINNEPVTIVQYLSTAEKSKLVERITNDVFDASGFASPVRTTVYFDLELVKSYSNINITDKMMETPDKTYDLLVLNNIVQIVKDNIPSDELDCIMTLVYSTINHIENYNTSLVGMFRTITSDENGTARSLEEILQDLQNNNNLELVNKVMEKMG